MPVCFLPTVPGVSHRGASGPGGGGACLHAWVKGVEAHEAIQLPVEFRFLCGVLSWIVDFP